MVASPGGLAAARPAVSFDSPTFVSRSQFLHSLTTGSAPTRFEWVRIEGEPVPGWDSSLRASDARRYVRELISITTL